MRKSKPKSASQKLLVAVETLRQYDHGFISEAGCHALAKPFGVEVAPYLHHAEPDHPKGLTFTDGAAAHIGLDAAELALQICGALGVPTLARALHGRGSQLRASCDALEQWASKQD